MILGEALSGREGIFEIFAGQESFDGAANEAVTRGALAEPGVFRGHQQRASHHAHLVFSSASRVR